MCGSHLQWAYFADIYFVGVFFAKISILLLYLRIFTYRNIFKYTVWVVAFIVFAQSVIGVFMNAFICKPARAAWQLWSFPNASCLGPWAVNKPIGMSNLITDMFIFVLPIPIILRLQMSPKQKSAVIVIFLLGAMYVRLHSKNQLMLTGAYRGSVFSALRLWSFEIWSDSDWTYRFDSQSAWYWWYV